MAPRPLPQLTDPRVQDSAAQMIPPDLDNTQARIASNPDTNPVVVVQVDSVLPPNVEASEELLKTTSSMEYQDTPDVTPPPNSAIGALEVVTSVIVICCVASFLGSVIRCVQLKRK